MVYRDDYTTALCCGSFLWVFSNAPLFELDKFQRLHALTYLGNVFFVCFCYSGGLVFVEGGAYWNLPLFPLFVVEELAFTVNFVDIIVA